jgi:hypothetical protein
MPETWTYLLPSTPPDPFETFRQRLHQLGYDVGRNITIEYRWGRPRRRSGSPKVKLIVAGAEAVAAARRAISTIPGRTSTPRRRLAATVRRRGGATPGEMPRRWSRVNATSTSCATTLEKTGARARHSWSTT